MDTYDSFPPLPPSEQLMQIIINSYCKDINPTAITEEGCAVCDMLYLSKEMQKMILTGAC
jgi:hypothetical protein